MVMRIRLVTFALLTVAARLSAQCVVQEYPNNASGTISLMVGSGWDSSGPGAIQAGADYGPAAPRMAPACQIS